ncbi:orotate phosphoribosyltransferase [Spectribacter hydrogenoxidans]|uniref:Orotate phosphoribosyltransferase n=1 Tax=Spectribacter hydrogenoxidans TaxID=3075608 RepID=A0ABU3BYN8_9GAMM|nr:orotate phosphoribosyltransferase [Salinisphaera sp. W335]MDT0634426.1 orotate phosphoribosyltransferase [Salinisphaera sp. W335]
MQDHKTRFLDLAFDHGALRLGEFTLKSGRVSPYFFNLGAIAGGSAMATLADCYARAILDAGIELDGLFGPAYKGIPLVTATACALAGHDVDLPFTYNRKEAKDHGEGGQLVGAKLAGRIGIVDDVITAGTAVREAIALIRANQAQPCALVVALDRQERGTGNRSALRELAEDTGIQPIAVCTVDDLLAYLTRHPGQENVVEAIRAYRRTYGDLG